MAVVICDGGGDMWCRGGGVVWCHVWSVSGGLVVRRFGWSVGGDGVVGGRDRCVVWRGRCVVPISDICFLRGCRCGGIPFIHD